MISKKMFSIKKVKALIFLATVNLILFEPGCISNYEAVDKLLSIFKVFVAVILIFKYVFSDQKLNRYLLLMISYVLILLGSSLINDEINFAVILEASYIVIFCMFAQMNLKNIDMYIDMQYFVLEIYAYLNLLSYAIWPEGMYINSIGFPCYFLGYRNTVYQYYFPMIVFSAIRSISKREKIGFRVYLDISCCLAFTVLTNSVTGMILMITCYIGVLALPVIKVIKMKWIVFAGSVVSFLLLEVKIQNYFTNFFVNVLGRRTDLSGRSILWDLLLKASYRRPILGWGKTDMVLLTHIYWAGQAHNQFLQVLFQSGIVGLGCFICVLLMPAMQFDRRSGNAYSGCMILIMILYMISFQTEGYVFPIFFSILLMIDQDAFAYSKKIKN